MNDTQPAAPGGSNDAEVRIQNTLGQLSEDWVITAVTGAGCTCTYTWPDGSVDTLFILPDATAQGSRDSAANQQVWRQPHGPVEDVLKAIQQQPPPGSPRAPTKPIRDRTEDL